MLWITWFKCESHVLFLRIGYPWEGTASLYSGGPRCESTENTENDEVQLTQYGQWIPWSCLHRYQQSKSFAVPFLLEDFTRKCDFQCFLLLNILRRNRSGLLFMGFILSAHCPSDHMCSQTMLLNVSTGQILSLIHRLHLIIIKERCLKDIWANITLDLVILKLPVTVHFKVMYIIENYIVLNQTWDN